MISKNTSWLLSMACPQRDSQGRIDRVATIRFIRENKTRIKHELRGLKMLMDRIKGRKDD